MHHDWTAAARRRSGARLYSFNDTLPWTCAEVDPGAAAGMVEQRPERVHKPAPAAESCAKCHGALNCACACAAKSEEGAAAALNQ